MKSTKITIPAFLKQKVIKEWKKGLKAASISPGSFRKWWENNNKERDPLCDYVLSKQSDTCYHCPLSEDDSCAKPWNNLFDIIDYKEEECKINIIIEEIQNMIALIKNI